MSSVAKSFTSSHGIRKLRHEIEREIKEMPWQSLDSSVELEAYLSRLGIAIVIPAYNEQHHILSVLESVPSYVRHVVVIDDCSTDKTADVIADYAAQNKRIDLIRHEKNQGVGGAMVSGFKRALELRAQIVVKVDADGQMSMSDLPSLLEPLVKGKSDYAKGNRFRDFRALDQMPAIRRFGNMALSFLTKAAVGYWNGFDPCNGYIAIRGEVLQQVPLHKLKQSFFFETSILAELYLLDAVVKDIPMPARYGDEVTHLSLPKVMGEFPFQLARCWAKRFLLKKYIYDFCVESIYILAGLPLLFGGLLFGGVNWWLNSTAGNPTPTGTIAMAGLLVVLGFQLLLAALNEDIRRVPHEPICLGPLRPINS